MPMGEKRMANIFDWSNFQVQCTHTLEGEKKSVWLNYNHCYISCSLVTRSFYCFFFFLIFFAAKARELCIYSHNQWLNIEPAFIMSRENINDGYTPHIDVKSRGRSRECSYMTGKHRSRKKKQKCLMTIIWVRSCVWKELFSITAHDFNWNWHFSCF